MRLWKHGMEGDMNTVSTNIDHSLKSKQKEQR